MKNYCSQIKFIGTQPHLISLHIVYNCFHDTTVELMIATEDHMAGKA
jgi:hypothetical protein